MSSMGEKMNAVVNDTSDGISLGIIAFPGYQPLDIWGPLELFFSFSHYKKMKLSIIAHKTGPVTSLPPKHIMGDGKPYHGLSLDPQIVATHTFANAPKLDILLVPGGMGTRVLTQVNDTESEDFIRARYPELKYLLSVCTGAVTLARSGVLDGRRATSNKASFSWVVQFGNNVDWVPAARWVQDGNIWTSSGVAAGIDMTYTFLKTVFPEEEETLAMVMNRIEYAPHTNPDWDPFAVVHKVPGVKEPESLADSVRPVGF